MENWEKEEWNVEEEEFERKGKERDSENLEMRMEKNKEEEKNFQEKLVEDSLRKKEKLGLMGKKTYDNQSQRKQCQLHSKEKPSHRFLEREAHMIRQSCE